MTASRNFATSPLRRALITMQSGYCARSAASRSASAAASPTWSILLKTRMRGTASAPISRRSVGYFALPLMGWIAVDDVEQRQTSRLVERRFERRDQPVRQVLDEADGVADQHARHALGLEGAHGGVERGEKFVFDQHLAAGECAH